MSQDAAIMIDFPIELSARRDGIARFCEVYISGEKISGVINVNTYEGYVVKTKIVDGRLQMKNGHPQIECIYSPNIQIKLNLPSNRKEAFLKILQHMKECQEGYHDS